MSQWVLQSQSESGADATGAPLCLLISQLRQLQTATPPTLTPSLAANPALAFALYAQAYAAAGAGGVTIHTLLQPSPELLQDLLCKALAQRAVLTSAADEIGAINAWQQQQLRVMLTQAVAKKLNYPNAELAGFAAYYCVVERSASKAYPVPVLWDDLRSTLHEPLAAQTDTALLSRLLWCCHHAVSNQLSVDESTITAFKQLLGLSEIILRELVVETRMRYEQLSFTTGVNDCYEQIQQGGTRADTAVQALKLQAQGLLQQSWFAQSLHAPVLSSSAMLKEQIQRLLLQLGMPTRYLLLAAKQDALALRVLLSGGCEADEHEFAIPLTSNSSTLGMFVKLNKIANLRAQSPELAPVDRQLIRLFNGAGALCIPFRGALVGALVLPELEQNSGDLGLLQEQLRSLVDLYHRQSRTDADPAVQLVRQQVRETIHEVNNPLAIIKNYLKLLAMKLPDSIDAASHIGVVEGEIERISNLLMGLRNAEQPSLEPTELDLNEVVRSRYSWLVNAFANKPGLRFEFVPAPAPAMAWASQASLTQILLNLVKNAAEALGENGSISLAVKRNVHFQGQLHVQILVSDNGPGLDASQLQMLFQPGRTTKGSGHTGAGLAIVKRLVDELKGQISCQSDINGTGFSILLPQVRV